MRPDRVRYARAAEYLDDAARGLPWYHQARIRPRLWWLLRQMRRNHVQVQVDSAVLCRIGWTVYHLLSATAQWSDSEAAKHALNRARAALQALGCK